ncbi:MAG: sigma-70 family RNA polymerase sigma factor [Pseudomonadales bacterium]|nr:sigma-70 family RNA polymerase sigma factor [Pseudomonadales bacterium]
MKDSKDSRLRSFIEAERQRLVGYVRSLVSETADLDAEDIVQDVLARLIERPEGMIPLDNLAAYVYRSLRNRVIDGVRARRPNVSIDAEDDDGLRLVDLLRDRRPDALEVLQTEEGRRELFEALAQLSEIERRVVIAHEFEGTGFKAMSAAWNMPVNTLLSHKSRAIRKLRKHLDRS